MQYQATRAGAHPAILPQGSCEDPGAMAIADAFMTARYYVGLLTGFC